MLLRVRGHDSRNLENKWRGHCTQIDTLEGPVAWTHDHEFFHYVFNIGCVINVSMPCSTLMLMCVILYSRTNGDGRRCNFSTPTCVEAFGGEGVNLKCTKYYWLSFCTSDLVFIQVSLFYAIMQSRKVVKFWRSGHKS